MGVCFFSASHPHCVDFVPITLYLTFLQFIENILEEGTKSPRTIRLAALHLTGLWLLNPKTIKYYMKELKLLTLYGSGAAQTPWLLISSLPFQEKHKIKSLQLKFSVQDLLF